MAIGLRSLTLKLLETLLLFSGTLTSGKSGTLHMPYDLICLSYIFSWSASEMRFSGSTCFHLISVCLFYAA